MPFALRKCKRRFSANSDFNNLPVVSLAQKKMESGLKEAGPRVKMLLVQRSEGWATVAAALAGLTG